MSRRTEVQSWPQLPGNHWSKEKTKRKHPIGKATQYKQRMKGKLPFLLGRHTSPLKENLMSWGPDQKEDPAMQGLHVKPSCLH